MLEVWIGHVTAVRLPFEGLGCGGVMLARLVCCLSFGVCFGFVKNCGWKLDCHNSKASDQLIWQVEKQGHAYAF